MLSVGIVVYRTGEAVLRRLLDSLLASVCATADWSMDVTIFVVCNDESADDIRSVAKLLDGFAQSLPGGMRCQLIEGHGNIGYGAAQNLAIERSAADFHLVLNADLVLDTAALSESLGFLNANPGAVMVVPQGYDERGRYANLAKRSPSLFVLLLRALSVAPSRGLCGRRVAHYLYDDRLPSERSQSIRLASGCFMFCRRSALRAVGGFDERYFLYFEDFDLSQRLAEYGRICEVPGVRIVHFGGRTASRGLVRILRFIQSAIRYFNTYGWRIL